MSGDPCGCDAGARPTPRVCDRHTIERLEQELAMARLRHMMMPIEDAPRALTTEEERIYLILVGDSGYIGTPHRYAVGYWCAYKQRWLTHSGDDFTDDGEPPTHWAPLLHPWLRT